MRVAEKRAAMAATGEPWPACDCHGEPCYWQARPHGGSFQCAVQRRTTTQKRRAIRATLGVCIQCGSTDLESETMCARCLAAHREAVWRHDQNPRRQIDKQLGMIRYRARRRAREGYEATGKLEQWITAELTKASD